MSDHTIITHDSWLVRSRVNDAIVLNTRSFADLDVSVVPPQDRPRPNRRVRTDSNVSDHHGIGVNEGSCVDTWAAIAQCINRHGSQSNWSAQRGPHRITSHLTPKGDLQSPQIP